MIVRGVPLSEIDHLIGGPTVDDLLRRAVEEAPEQLALRTETEDLTYAQLDADVSTWAMAIRHALTPFASTSNTVVALTGTLDLASARGFFAISRAGYIPAIVNPLLLEEGLVHVLRLSRATAAIVSPEVYSRLARVRHLLPDLKLVVLTRRDPELDAATIADLISDAPPQSLPERVAQGATACLQFTSGTTGAAKAVQLSHHNLVVNAAQTVQAHRLKNTSVLFNILPTFHLMHLTIGVSAAATHVLWPGTEIVAAVEAADRVGATHFYSLPMQLIRLARDPDLSTLKARNLDAILCGGSALPAQVAQALTHQFGVPVAQGYGLQETSPSTHFADLSDPMVGCAGHPVAGTQCRIVDVETRVVLGPQERGEIEVRGPQVMIGYLPTDLVENPDNIGADGWLSTGDFGYHDNDGRLFIIDRIKDVFKCDNWLVSPTEIERVLRRHPDVVECVVVDYPDEISDGVAYALVQPRHDDVAPEELVAFVNGQVPYYEHIRHLELVTQIPRSATGKVQRREIRALVRRQKPCPPHNPGEFS